METPREIYTALASLNTRHREISREPAELDGHRGVLTPFEVRVFSQNGEDGVIAEIAARIGTGEPFFVEFGVESGHEGNCVYLADVAGWPGLFIEADADSFALLEDKYRGNDRVRTTHASVTADNVQALFAAAGVPTEPTVLSIDVDGCDYWIWDSIVDFRPRIVVIEYNSALDPRRRLVQPAEHTKAWDGSNYYGASLGALRMLGERKGYRLVHTDLCAVNAFFVREDLAGGRFPACEDAPVRSLPNYFQTGRGHSPDLAERRYLDLDTNNLVSVHTPQSAPTLAEEDEISLLRERMLSAEMHLARSSREMVDANTAYETTRRAYESIQAAYESTHTAYEASEAAYQDTQVTLEETKRELDRRERAADRANTLLAERNAALRTSADAVAALQAQVGELEARLATTSASLATVVDSKSWRITRPLRALGRVARRT